MSIELPKLPFPHDALEPFMSSETLYFHYNKHHAGYVDKLNKLISGTDYEPLSLEEIIYRSYPRPEDKKIFNNAAQVWNHNFFWQCLRNPGPTRSRSIDHRLNENFGSTNAFLEQWVSAGENLFGSGYLWLVQNPDASLDIISTKNAENPLILGLTPLLTCDVWEHAYYLDSQNDRRKYLDQFVQLINWNFVEDNLENAKHEVRFSPQYNNKEKSL